ncbi:hypothetical protein MtrunA17_Chr4g0009551 [Medicago truncatula]|uniref:Uncharacterized protein n=1 Tax=Medicago truncatula TaxID=3880 RepID=A0A396I4G4_MEDTR|nr:hypothetical protein MtrunA17_Chr4g0009551 [Medicago truncatula]
MMEKISLSHAKLHLISIVLFNFQITLNPKPLTQFLLISRPAKQSPLSLTWNTIILR